MKILDLHIHAFGGLENYSLEMSEGLLFLYGENESGKSTIQAFILAMFYGFGRAGRDPEKSARLRYAPWQNPGAMGGSIRFSHEGRIYRLERSFGRSKSEDRAALYDELTGDVHVLSDPDCPGAELFSLSESEFSMLCLIGRASEGEYADGVDARVAGLTESGEEGLSVTKIQKLLEKEERRLASGPDGGEIGRNERQIQKLSYELKTLEAQDDERWELLERCRALEEEWQDKKREIQASRLDREITKAEKECQAWEDYLQKNTQGSEFSGLKGVRAVPVRELTRLSGQYRKIQLALDEKQRLTYGLEETEQEIKRLISRQYQMRKEGEESRRAIESLTASLSEDAEARTKPSNSTPLFLLSFLPLLLILILKISRVEVTTTALILTALLPITAFVLLFMRERRLSEEKRRRAFHRRHQLEKLEFLKTAFQRAAWSVEQIEEDIRRYESRLEALRSASAKEDEKLRKERRALKLDLTPWLKEMPEDLQPEEILQLLRDYSLSYRESAAEKQGLTAEKEEERRLNFENTSRLLERLRRERRELGIESSDWDEERLHWEMARERELFERLAAEKAALDVRMPDGLNPADLEREILECHKSGENLRLRLSAVQDAKSILEEAGEHFRREARPALMERAGGWLRVLSGGKYTTLSLDQNKKLRAVAPGDLHYHEDVYYSSGTRDLLWLSLRLAAGDLIFSEWRMPLILDDSLLYLDTERLRMALKALQAYSEEENIQILLLSASEEGYHTAVKLAIECRQI